MTRADLEELWTGMRPNLHRYCARMVGSAIDGEDLVQETMVKALGALGATGRMDNPEGWLFRIAHNASLDFLRRRQREPVMEEKEEIKAVPAPANDDPDITATSLRTFLRLPALQRSTVILKDVVGHSLEEVASIVGVTEPAAKSALQRGRSHLRELAREPDEVILPVLSDVLRARLSAYVEAFRVGDFDAVRTMLAEEVQLDLVDKISRKGKSQVSEYYARYAACEQWAYAAGVVEGRPVMLVYDREVSLETPAYFVALTFAGNRVVAIRDFLFARYAIEGVEMQVLRAAGR